MILAISFFPLESTRPRQRGYTAAGDFRSRQANHIYNLLLQGVNPVFGNEETISPACLAAENFLAQPDKTARQFIKNVLISVVARVGAV